MNKPIKYGCMGIMTPITKETLEIYPNKSCYYTAEDYERLAALVDPAPPAGVWGIDPTAGRPILVYQGCSVIEAEQAYYVLGLINGTVPPAGGEVEVLMDQCDECARLTYAPGGDAKWCSFCGAKLLGSTEPLPMVDRAHLTRLQAEVERERKTHSIHAATLQAEVNQLKQGSQLLIGDLERRDATVERLQAELTEVLGLLKEADDFMYIMTGNDTQRDLDAKYGRLLWEDAIINLRGKIATALNQSAPVKEDPQNG